MNLHIREFDPKDYDDAVAIGNNVYVEYPETADEWRFQDEHRDPKCRFQRYVGELDGRTVATAAYGNSAHMFHPQKFWVDVTVDPDFQRQGVGSAMYRKLEEVLAEFSPIKLWSAAREDFDASIKFLEQRGFAEVMRAWESRLYVDDFDFEPFEGRIDAVESNGIRVETFESLSRDPDHLTRLYDLIQEVDRDVPSPDEPTPMDFDVWVDRVRSNPNLMPDAYFIAVDGERYIAMSNLWLSQAQDDEVYVGLTGTRRDYRRRGIATALKLKTIEYAAGNGIKVLKTWNETGNEGMLAINTMLGFVRQPAWIDYERVIED
jgi:GNAT superfamily N-acetyltransferase